MKKVHLLLSAALMTAVTITGNGKYLAEAEGSFSAKQSSLSEVTIGNQVWSTRNLEVTKFRNGDSIPHAETDEEWDIAYQNEQPAWCYYGNDPSNGEKYGKIYNWYAVNDPRGLAPEGWHIPSDAEWTQLTDHLGGDNAAGTKMKTTSGWTNSGNGTNESGFSGLPGGWRGSIGRFSLIGKVGIWWSSTEVGPSLSWNRSLSFGNDKTRRDYEVKGFGFSVRCLRD